MDSYGDEQSYGKDNSYDKSKDSVNVKKIQCNNFNINGLEIGFPPALNGSNKRSTSRQMKVKMAPVPLKEVVEATVDHQVMTTPTLKLFVYSITVKKNQNQQ